MKIRDNILKYVDNILNFFLIKYKKISIGYNCQILGILCIYGSKNKILIGNNCIFRSGLRTNPLGGGDKIVICVSGVGKLEIGSNVGISNSCIRCFNKIVIEDNVLIGGDCKIYDSDMHSIGYFERMKTPDVSKKSAPIIIKNGAWIGAHSIILKGVTIGERSVVGAGSVVTKNIPADEVWAGNPAKYIKKLTL